MVSRAGFIGRSRHRFMLVMCRHIREYGMGIDPTRIMVIAIHGQKCSKTWLHQQQDHYPNYHQPELKHCITLTKYYTLLL